jgi:hypothetical protein
VCIFDVKLARNTQAMPQGEVLINPPLFYLILIYIAQSLQHVSRNSIGRPVKSALLRLKAIEDKDATVIGACVRKRDFYRWEVYALARIHYFVSTHKTREHIHM